MSTQSNSSNVAVTLNSIRAFARRNWLQIVWLIVAIIGIICIVSLILLVNSPKALPKEVQMQLMNVFFVVYFAGLIRSQFIYRVRGARFGLIHANERNKQQRLRNESRYSSSVNLSAYGSPFLGAIRSWILSKLFWFFISGLTWPFIEAFVQVRFLISSDARHR